MADGPPAVAPDWEAIERLLDRALELSPVEQDALLARAGSDDPALAAAVRRLVDAGRRVGTFLEQPAASYAGPLLAWVAGREPLEPGASLGPYEIVRRLGRGATATVFLARDPKHRRSVAVKVLHPDLAAAVGAERFLREIEIAATLQHPHILPLFDSGAVDGLLYYVMPHVEGESLRDRLRDGRRLPAEEALRIAGEVAGALDYSHRRGVVHRDIKPENILLQDGQAVVADFGIARAIAAGDDAAGVHGTGTPAYMSPEQADPAGQIDGRTDIYALGCVLYEMLCGEALFAGESAEQILAHHARSPVPPVSRSGVTIAPPVQRALDRALAKQPADRFATAADMGAALRAAAAESGDVFRSRRARPRRVVAAAVAALTVVGVAVATLRPHDAPPSRGTQLGHRSRLTLGPGFEIDAALSPDGRQVAYGTGPASDVTLYRRPIAGGTVTAVAPAAPRPQRFPRWAKDGRRLLFRSPRGIEVAEGGATRVLIGDPGPPAPDSGRLQAVTTVLMPGGWAPDGRRFLFVRRDSLFVADSGGRLLRLLANGGELHSAMWSPDGHRIAFVSGNRQALETGFFFGNAGRSAIWTVDADSGSPTPLSPGRGSDASPVWLPGGRVLLFISDRDGGRDIYEVAVDARGLEAEPTRLTTGLNPSGISLSADGRRIIYTVLSERSNIWSLPIPTGGMASISRARAVTTGPQVIEGFDVSPDGRWLAFDGDRSGQPGLYRVRLPDGPVEQLSSGPGDFGPFWSPDGRQLAFHGFRDGARHIFVMSSRGTDRIQVTRGSTDDRGPIWLDAGRAILYRSLTKDEESVRIVARDESGGWGEPRTILRGDILHVTASPDLQWLAYTTPRGLEVSTASGAFARTVADRSTLPGIKPSYVAWSDDSRTIYFLALDSIDRASVWSVPRTGGAPRKLVAFDDPAREWHRFGFRARNGKFYFTLGDRQSELWQLDVVPGAGTP